MVLPTLASGESMLPPKASGTIELRTSPAAGATPMQPKKGRSGILTEKLESKALKVAVPVL
jgi:hypothetical protein